MILVRFQGGGQMFNHIFIFKHKNMKNLIKKILLEYNTKSIEVIGYRGVGDAVNATYGPGISDDGMGVFWTDNLTMAKWFAGLIEYSVDTDQYEKIPNSKGEILKKKLRLNNPYIIDSDDEDYDSFQVYMDELNDIGSVNEYRQGLLDDGYDSIILKNNNTNYYESGTYDIYIVL